MTTRTGLEYGLGKPFGCAILRNADGATTPGMRIVVDRSAIGDIPAAKDPANNRYATGAANMTTISLALRGAGVSRFDEPLSATLGLETTRANLPITAGNPGQPSTRTTGQLWPVYG